MPRFQLKLEEQVSDARSDEIAYRFTIENHSSAALGVQSLRALVPDGIEVVEVKDRSREATRLKHDRLCQDLTGILHDLLVITSKEFREQWVSVNLSIANEVMARISSRILWLALRLSVRQIKKTLELETARVLTEMGRLSFNIQGIEDAELALKTWFGTHDAPHEIGRIFQAKVEQLRALAEDMNRDAAQRALATIEPDSFFAATYVVRARRRMLDPRRFNFTVECGVSQGPEAAEQTAAATTVVLITPRPYALSIVAVVGAILGVAANTAASTQAPVSWANIGSAFASGSAVSSLVLALLLANVYEHTDLSKRIVMGIGWRSAMLIGALCGLFGDRMLAALRAFGGG